jgi:hypothetical protein
MTTVRALADEAAPAQASVQEDVPSVSTIDPMREAISSGSMKW